MGLYSGTDGTIRLTNLSAAMKHDRDVQWAPVFNAIRRGESLAYRGRVAEARGTLITVTGLSSARIGELCVLKDQHTGHELYGEVIGIRGNQILLTPLGPLEGVSAKMEVISEGEPATVAVGHGLLGRVVDAHGKVIDGKGDPECHQRVSIYQNAPDPLHRAPICEPLVTGVKAIDSALTTGIGQRVGIFAMAGGGKSTLLGMLARGAQAEINVIVLIGERGREVQEFIEDNLGEQGLQKSVIVLATADRPALERSRAACVGTAIAEYFRDQGKSVLLMMDSVTRYARALRDVGLALGEPPVRRGFTPSVFSMLPRLFERAGNNDKGSMTAFYTVLLEEEEQGDDPVGEEVRSLLDGHIILSRKLASAAHYPAIDVLNSASRVMNRVVTDEHLGAAKKLRENLARYQEVELLLQLGEYKTGTDANIDAAVSSYPRLMSLLRQSEYDIADFDQTFVSLQEACQ
ncbi:MAG: FliI/YscN family ATPase [Pseudomonadales bacterium]|nr:FliI/YscN family ATPase [Pseudomonadales bacterium]